MIDIRNIVTMLAILLIVIDVIFAVLAYRKHVREGRYLCQASILAAVVTFSYLISILETDYFRASVMSSIYFIAIDWLLLIMIKLVIAITTQGRVWRRRGLMYLLDAYAVFDTVVLLINPFKEIAVHYLKRESLVACYYYQMKPLYYAHLVFTYLLVIGVLGILFHKLVKTPRQYRNQYRFIADIIILIVIMNALFLIPQIRQMYSFLDISIVCYSIGLLAIYWSSFEYRNHYLQHGLSTLVLDNMNQGVMLFDYDGFLIMKNEKAGEMIPFMRFHDVMRGSLHVSDFVRMVGITAEQHDTGRHYSIQLFADAGVDKSHSRIRPEDWTFVPDRKDQKKWHAFPRNRDEEEGIPLRCDYMRLEDSRKKRVGELFVFTAATDEIDILTGYHSWEFFQKYVGEHTARFSHPCAVACFDINDLALLNRKRGKETGDAQIRNLSEIIRQCMPEESYYVRGYDAQLIVISYFTDEMTMRQCGRNVMEEFDGSVEAGYSSSDTEDADILVLIREADRSMTYKKLMDGNSARSQTMSSLIRALKESDSDTEAHVQRTQTMGRELGRRFGLTDLEQSQLAMLCLLHDIGKVGVPLEILNKPGRLTDEEWAVLKTHPEKGFQIAHSSFELRDIADMILYHHERWDGKGYPKGLSGEQIPFLSRIISVIDAYDAMVSNRSYRKGMPPEKAREELRRCAGSQFDPDIAKEFLQMLEEDPDIFDDKEGRSAAVVTEIFSSPHTDEDEKPLIAAGEMIYARPERDGFLDLPTAEALKKTDQLKGRPGRHIQSHPVMFSRYEMNLDDLILSADDNFESFTGYGPEDIARGRLHQRNLIPEEDRDSYFAEVDRQLEKGNLVYMEHYILRKDGGRIYVFCYAKKLYHSASKSMRIEVIIVDIARTSLVHRPS